MQKPVSHRLRSAHRLFFGKPDWYQYWCYDEGVKQVLAAIKRLKEQRKETDDG